MIRMIGPAYMAISVVCPVESIRVTDGIPTLVLASSVPADDPRRVEAQALFDAWDWSPTAETARQNLRDRIAAKATFATATDDRAKAWRAIVSLLIDELNASRGWIMAFKAAVAAATTLADLKTRVAALSNLPDRTLTQAKAAFAAKIDGGTVD